MKKILLHLLAVASIFVATSANAAPSITLAEFNAGGDAYVAANPSVAPDWNSLKSCCQNTLQAALDQYNNVLSATPACASVGVVANYNACYAALGSLPPVTSGGTTIPVAQMVLQALAQKQTPTPPPVGPPTPPACCYNTPSSSVAQIVSQVVTPQIQRATSIQQATIISNVVSNIFSTRASMPGAQIRTSFGGEKVMDEKGMAAGDSPAKLNAWFNASNTSIGNSTAASNFSGDVNNVLAGVDYIFSPQFVAGVSLGYDRVSLDYNGSSTHF